MEISKDCRFLEVDIKPGGRIYLCGACWKRKRKRKGIEDRGYYVWLRNVLRKRNNDS